MIRVVIFLLAVCLVASGAAWLADQQGEVIFSWHGRPYGISLLVAAVAVAVVAALAVVLWTILRAILRAPRALRHAAHARRNARGFLALSRGLLAVGSGDLAAARKFADEARRFASAEPLTLLLGAQTAQLAGDRAGAERVFQTMTQHHETRLLGLHGLFIEAQRRRDPAAARLFAEEAARAVSVPAWAGRAVLQFRSVAGDFEGALERLERNLADGLIDRAAHRRQRAVLLTARALASETTDRAGARAQAEEAVKLAPTLVPAAALAGRLLGENGELRKAARLIETAWKANPHPDLADTYAHLRPGASARERLERVQALAQRVPGHIEAALAVAGAALDAQEFAVARAALADLVRAPTRRVALLMARLEQIEHGDEGRAREWMTRALHARRDPVWTADGVVSDRWMPVSPVSGRLDGFEWREPLAEIGGAVIEGADMSPPPATTNATNGRDAAARDPDVTSAGASPVALPSDEAPASPPEPAIAMPAGVARGADAGKPFERVIPLLHAPDDPGPDAAPPAAEPETEPAEPPPPNGWDRLRALFR
jgi:HemY protein